MEEVICKNCGLEGDYTAVLKSNNMVANCNGCGKYIKNISQNTPPKLYFGKYRGLKVSKITDKNYLEWVLNETDQPEKIKIAIELQLKNIHNG